MKPVPYVDLQVTTNFSFLRGGSHPDELAQQAAALGHEAIAVTDRNSLAGVVRAHAAAREAGIRLVVGAQLDLEDGANLLAYPTDRAAYGRLARLITLGRRRAVKGECRLTRSDVMEWGADIIFIAVPPDDWSDPDAPEDAFAAQLRELVATFSGNCFLAAHHLYRGDDAHRLARLDRLAEACTAPMVATNDIHMHDPQRRVLADVLTCIREKCTIDEAGYRLFANAERHLKPGHEMAQLFSTYPHAVARTVEIAGRCRFSLDELRYEYPDEVVDEGQTPQQTLVRLAWEGAENRYPAGVPDKVKAQIEHELVLIDELNYAPYFLTVHDLVRFARSRDILCQGRGSAANSAVCYCLGVTAVDPARINLLFERFVSAERREPPDIDVDFEHARREEVIQYVYEKYGRERAGMTATVNCYRSRGAIREVGKALGLSQDTVGAIAGHAWGSSNKIDKSTADKLGLDRSDCRLQQALDLAAELIGFPRHLSQHVGGLVITRGRLDEVVPIENAAMEDRTVIEWDKDDLNALGMLKVDVLALGMLTCLHKGFDLIRRHYGCDLDHATVPSEDPAVYAMLQKADSIGVFQVESRAQMSFLPRMKPKTFYDLVIEVAIVRPGPIQGGMVHPYLRRRNGEEKENYPSEELREVLQRTHGVPLFQEQAMQIAIVGAGFTPAESDRLRCAMATFRRLGTIHTFRTKFIDGMVNRGYERDFAERCFRQIEGFADYGFPESHAASFALLVYVSAWMKCHYPAVFACALLNSQPMGFYAPAQIVRDAREHGVEIRPPCVNHSTWDCTLEPGGDPKGPARGLTLRLGLRQIKSLSEANAERLVDCRGNGYTDPTAVWRRTGLSRDALEAMARGDVFHTMGLGRREALWAIRGLGDTPLPLFAVAGEEDRGVEPEVNLPGMGLGEQVVEDYSSLRLSLRCHPLTLLRDRCKGVIRAGRLIEVENGARVSVCGLVLVRQRPDTAKGVIFMTLEDETGVANVIVWRNTFERYRRIVLTTRLVRVTGELQRQGIVTHVIADRLEDLSHLLDHLGEEDGLVPQSERGDEARVSGPPDPSGGPSQTRRQAARHPRDQAKVLIQSRDFH
jgi:error-prone DNA polymerase